MAKKKPTVFDIEIHLSAPGETGGKQTIAVKYSTTHGLHPLRIKDFLKPGTVLGSIVIPVLMDHYIKSVASKVTVVQSGKTTTKTPDQLGKLLQRFPDNTVKVIKLEWKPR